MLRIEDAAYRTDTGRQRNANEDSFYTRPPLFVVADGMGGAQAGEVASKTAAETFQGELAQGSPENALGKTIEAANRRVHELALSDPSLAGMGTTVTAAIVDPEAEEVAIGHVGDSRAYRLRGAKLEQLTRDHSLVEEMRRKGQLTDAQAEDHPQRSIITRALGPEPEVEVDLQTVSAKPGDVFLICSDGLTTMLDDEHVARLLMRATTMDAAVRALVDEANRAGGRDNITVVAFKLEDVAAPAKGNPEGATLIRHARLRAFAKVAAVLLVVGAVALGAWYGARQVWFLGTDAAGRVALYRGLPYELPFGIKLYSEHFASPIQTGALPARRRDAVTGHDLRSREDAVSLIEDIQKSQGVP